MLTMNSKAFFLTLAILAAVVTIYPPYLWGQERIEEWKQLAATGNTELVDDYPKNVPLKTRSFLFAGNSVDTQTRWGWDDAAKKSVLFSRKLYRRLSWEDLLLEYVLAVCVAVIIGALASKRSNHDR